MAEYEIQKDFGKAVEWLSHVKEQAYKGVDDAYKEIKAHNQTKVSTVKHEKPVPSPTPPPAIGSTVAVVVGYGMLVMLIVFFLFRDRDSWLHRAVIRFQHSRKRTP
ncbi:hypothetical protein NB311A_19597 [Nitrobacter sp. Nb-311A]|uniref:hypothetical protein n=1 Tax=Nitrobacter sp. Nb-311A TaxID=314253 RepID=UPI0000685F91|nr:hypothetical protein [Nitrobacter sp. Nb-311A]EAQ34808.1 hypothetical protein NB311A_19597 [Nitrobacter sp. Nb-311A]